MIRAEDWRPLAVSISSGTVGDIVQALAICRFLPFNGRGGTPYRFRARVTDGIVGGMTLKAREGNLVVQNIGSGPALNVRYEFNPIDPPPGANVARPRGYLQNIPSREIFVMSVAREVLEHLRIVKLGFCVLSIWSVFAYLPLWFHSIKQLGKTFGTYGSFFLHK